MQKRWIAAILADATLPPQAVRVATVLNEHFNSQTRECWPAVGTIAGRIRKTPRTVQATLAAMEKRGHIERSHGQGGAVRGAPGRRTSLCRMSFRDAEKLSTWVKSHDHRWVKAASPRTLESLNLKNARARARETTTAVGACQTRARPEISDPAPMAEEAAVTPEEQAASRARIEAEMRDAGIPVFPRNRPVADQQADPEPLPELPAAPATATLPETPEEWAAFRARQYELLRISGFREVIIGREAPEPAAAPVLPSQLPADRAKDAERQEAPAADVALEARRAPLEDNAAVPDPGEAPTAASDALRGAAPVLDLCHYLRDAERAQEPPRTPVGGSAAVTTAPATRRRCPSRSGPLRPWRFITFVYPDAATGENRLDTT